MDLLPSPRSVQKFLAKNLPESITNRVKCLAKEDKRIDEVNCDPVPVEAFLEHRHRQLKGDALEIEYKAVVKADKAFAQQMATLAANQTKNTHDVLPYDHCRVILQQVRGRPATDYINASLISGMHKRTNYIAAQGPCTATMNDFWRMVWQENVGCIVMLTKFFSYSKMQCEKYWHNTYNLYGDIHVRQDSQEDACHYTFRRFWISKIGQADRSVIHCQVHTWDEKEPPDVSAMLEFRRKVKAFADSNSKKVPLLVHCGDGAGRTGAFITLDVVLEKLTDTGNIDIIGTLKSLRMNRPQMVSNLVQYKFIYDAVAMHLQCGTTVIRAGDLTAALHNLAQVDSTTNMTGFEREFKTLAEVVPPLCSGDCAGGHRVENRRRSRDVMIQPPERARPYLLTFDSSDNSDFINAVYVNGYRQMNEYIVTQWPLRHTVNELWRLLFDYHISTVVVLHDAKYSLMYPQFWPYKEGFKQKYGPVCSTPLGSETVGNLTSKSFLVRKAICNPLDLASAGNSDSLVKFIFLRNWPDSDKIPENASVLLELMAAAQNWKSETSTQALPVLVMSKDGVSRAGIFCALSIAYERLQAENEVDIFGVVKMVKMNRPQLVRTVVEYEQLYRLAEYIHCYAATAAMLPSACETASEITGSGGVGEGSVLGSEEPQCCDEVSEQDAPLKAYSKPLAQPDGQVPNGTLGPPGVGATRKPQPGTANGGSGRRLTQVDDCASASDSPGGMSAAPGRGGAAAAAAHGYHPARSSRFARATSSGGSDGNSLNSFKGSDNNSAFLDGVDQVRSTPSEKRSSTGGRRT